MHSLHDRSCRGVSSNLSALVLGLALLTWPVGALAEPSQGPSAEPEAKPASGSTTTSDAQKEETPKVTEGSSKAKPAATSEAKREKKPATTAKQTAKPNAPANPKGEAAAKPTPSKNVTAASKGATASKSGKAPAAPSASAAKKTAPASQAATARGQARTHTVVSQEERVTYQYNALGRRDPFQPLIDGGFVGKDVLGDALPDVGGLTVVGIVWGARDKFALAEDPAGNSLVLRRGDKVMNGFVERLQRDAVIVRLLNDGQSESVTIPLTRKGDDHGSN